MSLSFGLCLCAFFRAYLMWRYVYRPCCVLERIPGLPLDFSFPTLVTLSESPKCPDLKGTSKLEISLQFLKQVMNAFCYISTKFSRLSPAYQPLVLFLNSLLITLQPDKSTSVRHKLSAPTSFLLVSLRGTDPYINDLHALQASLNLFSQHLY